MEHFVAYHNVDKQAATYSPGRTCSISSKKRTLLENAIDQTVWVIQGQSMPGIRKGVVFSLCAAFLGKKVSSERQSVTGWCRISGPALCRHTPPIVLNDLDWFPAFFRSQNNFSYGFNYINDADAIRGLISLPKFVTDSEENGVLPDIDLPTSAREGKQRLSLHLRRERDRSIVEAKKSLVMQRAGGRLICEACGFDFLEAYGKVGQGFCEVHHNQPLAQSGATVTTLDDLSILCSNCHRIIHKMKPMPPVSDFASKLRQSRLRAAP